VNLKRYGDRTLKNGDAAAMIPHRHAERIWKIVIALLPIILIAVMMLQALGIAA
jgi:hypothetical protein